MAPVVRLAVRISAAGVAWTWAMMIAPLAGPWSTNAAQHYSVGLWQVFDANKQNLFANRHGFERLPEDTGLIEKYDTYCEWLNSDESDPWCEAGAISARVFSCLTLFLLVPPTLYLALRWRYMVRQGRADVAARSLLAAAVCMTCALVSWDEGYLAEINSSGCSGAGTCQTLHAGFITLAMGAAGAYGTALLLWMLGRQDEEAWHVEFARAAKGGDLTTMLDFLEADNPEFDLDKPGDEGMSAMHWAAAKNLQAIVHALIKHGGSVNVRDHWGWTPAHWACRNGHADMLEELLQLEADPALADEHGVTPLMLCVASNCVDGLTALLRAGVDPNHATVRGETALLMCANMGIQRRNMATHLINAGADVAAANAHGDSVLHLAACAGDDRLTRMALQVGGERLVYRRNRDGASPAEEARVRGQDDTIKAIDKYVRKRRKQEERERREEEKMRKFREENAARIAAAQEAEGLL